MSIARAEVQQIERIVADEVHQMIPNATALACGTYRRGKTASGDCDILITDPDGDSCDILPGLLERLHASGFLTGNEHPGVTARFMLVHAYSAFLLICADDLMHSQKQKAGGCDTYMGVCRVSKVCRSCGYIVTFTLF